MSIITSFKKGYGQVKQKDLAPIRLELMAALNINNRNSLNLYMKGSVEPKVSQAKAIEAIFEKYGVTDIWGDE